MIRLIELRTDIDEKDLFLRLVLVGRHANRPVFSTDRYDWDEGWVSFVRLDCAPAPSFRVAVSGSCLFVSEQFLMEVESWLRMWSIPFDYVQKHRLPNREAVWSVIKKHRRENTLNEESRKDAWILISRKLKEAEKVEDKYWLDLESCPHK